MQREFEGGEERQEKEEVKTESFGRHSVIVNLIKELWLYGMGEIISIYMQI